MLPLVKMMFSADDVHRRGQIAPRCLLLIHTGLAFTTCNKTSSVLSPHTRKNNSINYVIIINFSITVHLLQVTQLVEVHYSIKYIHIHDSKFANKMGVNKDYRSFSCDAMQSAHVLAEHTTSNFRAAKGHTLEGLLTPATIGTVYHQAQKSHHTCQGNPVNNQHRL